MCKRKWSLFATFLNLVWFLARKQKKDTNVVCKRNLSCNQILKHQKQVLRTLSGKENCFRGENSFLALTSLKRVQQSSKGVQKKVVLVEAEKTKNVVCKRNLSCNQILKHKKQVLRTLSRKEKCFRGENSFLSLVSLKRVLESSKGVQKKVVLVCNFSQLSLGFGTETKKTKNVAAKEICLAIKY